MLANDVFWRLILFYTHLLLLLQPSVLWLSNSIVTFNNSKPPPKRILREFDVSRIRPQLGGLPHLEINVYMAKFDPGWEGYPIRQTGLPALAGHPTYHVNVIIWTGRLPHLRRLPHLPGVPHLHVNRPLDASFRKIVIYFMLSDLRLGSFVSRIKYWNATILAKSLETPLSPVQFWDDISLFQWLLTTTDINQMAFCNSHNRRQKALKHPFPLCNVEMTFHCFTGYNYIAKGRGTEVVRECSKCFKVCV